MVLLHTEALTRRRLDAQAPLDTEVFMRRNFAHKSFYTQMF